MGITREQALDCFRSDDLIGIGMEADAVRRRLHPEGVVSYAVEEAADGFAAAPGTVEWVEAHRTAHAGGERTTAVLVFGAGETLEERVDRLEAIRSLQQETGGFVAFVPMASQPDGAHAPGWEEATAVESLKTMAICRMYLDNIEHVQMDLATMGLKALQMGLRFGANDVGAVGTGATEEELRRIIRDAGFRPVERDAGYRTVFLS